MKRFLLTLAALIGLVNPVLAADITHWGKNLFILGELANQDYDKFYEIMAYHGDEIKDVWITSIGGSYNDGLLIGTDVKSLGLNTIALGECYSACAYIWLAGANRQVFEHNPEDLTFIGIHMPAYVKDPSKPIPQWILRKTEWYLDLLELPESAKVEILATPNEKMLLLGPNRMKSWGLTVTRLE